MDNKYNDGKPYIDFFNNSLEELKDRAKDYSEGNQKLEELLLNLWKHNIKTLACCAGHSCVELKNQPGPFKNPPFDTYLSIIIDKNNFFYIRKLIGYLSNYFELEGEMYSKKKVLQVLVSKNSKYDLFTCCLNCFTKYSNELFDRINQFTNNYENNNSLFEKFLYDAFYMDYKDSSFSTNLYLYLTYYTEINQNNILNAWCINREDIMKTISSDLRYIALFKKEDLIKLVKFIDEYKYSNIIYEIVKENPDILQYLRTSIDNYYTIVSNAVKINPMCIKYVQGNDDYKKLQIVNKLIEEDNSLIENSDTINKISYRISYINNNIINFLENNIFKFNKSNHEIKREESKTK